MTDYIQFDNPDGSFILVEVDEELSYTPGTTKAGVREKLEEAIDVAQNTLENALVHAIRYNANAFHQAIKDLSDPPNIAEITFAIKITGEVSNVAVG